MINGGCASAAGGAGFPDPPKGSPGAITASAHTLSSAADELEHAHGGLLGANAALESDWQGYAAAAYHASSSALASVAQGGISEFRQCAQAVSSYATALDHAQSEIRRLKTLYEDAKRRQGAAGMLAGSLGNALGSATHPADVTRLSAQITAAERQATDAGTEADGYARLATTALDQFKQEAFRYVAVLDGLRPGTSGGPFGSPFAGTGNPGSGFGSPFSGPMLSLSPFTPGALAPYSGVIPVGDPWNSPVPGYGTYLDSKTQGLSSPPDLTLAIGFLAGGIAGPLADVGAGALRSVAESFGVGAGRDAAETASRKVAQEILDKARASGLTRSTSMSSVLQQANAAGRAEAARIEASQLAGRKLLAKQAIDAAASSGLLKPGMKEILGEIVDRGSFYLGRGKSELSGVASTLSGSSNPAVRAIASRLRSILRAPR